jgi:flagellar biosynthetic protein FliP
VIRFAAIVALACLLPVQVAWGAAGLPALVVTAAGDGTETYTLSIQILLAMTVLTLLPAALMMMTSFTRIIIVLAILRQALGTAQTPTNQILIGLALFLTLFIMAPVFHTMNETALQPYQRGELETEAALAAAAAPLKKFMLDQTREGDLALFARLSGLDDPASLDDVPFLVAVPAFVTSELKTAFQIGFLLFIPFLVIDLVVASVLMSMGMMMMSPMMVSLPFKIMLFVLVDGWALLMGALASSFYLG